MVLELFCIIGVIYDSLQIIANHRYIGFHDANGTPLRNWQ